ncbi:hypothetical protein [Vulcanisaeta distributa]|uniref:hypothetical protein n=1 Tax=Vulcanisaeta distributa TaxID=164451 RepID=UPI0006D038D5|nr:hypothetical protein [Vulcanisaeta distributa]
MIGLGIGGVVKYCLLFVFFLVMLSIGFGPLGILLRVRLVMCFGGGDRVSGPVSIKGPSEGTGFPFKGLVDRYIDALFRVEREGGSVRLLLRGGPDEATPIIALFHVIDVGGGCWDWFGD